MTPVVEAPASNWTWALITMAFDGISTLRKRSPTRSPDCKVSAALSSTTVVLGSSLASSLPLGTGNGDGHTGRRVAGAGGELHVRRLDGGARSDLDVVEAQPDEGRFVRALRQHQRRVAQRDATVAGFRGIVGAGGDAGGDFLRGAARARTAVRIWRGESRRIAGIQRPEESN